jgi:hypothetical protein
VHCCQWRSWLSQRRSVDLELSTLTGKNIAALGWPLVRSHTDVSVARSHCHRGCPPSEPASEAWSSDSELLVYPPFEPPSSKL